MNISYKYQIIVMISFINIISSSICAKENYILSTVNTIPISKIDVINRAKLISFSINQDLKFKNLKNFYNQSYILLNKLKDFLKVIPISLLMDYRKQQFYRYL